MSTETATLSVECDVHFRQRYRGRKEMQAGADTRPALPPGRIPRVSRLMALAIRFDGLVRSGAVRDYADLARLGRVTRARMSQIMSLINLSPEIQEAILFLPPIVEGRDPLVLRDVLPVALQPDWRRQMRAWTGLTGERLSLNTARAHDMVRSYPARR
jgi:hypothetical protein